MAVRKQECLWLFKRFIINKTCSQQIHGRCTRPEIDSPAKKTASRCRRNRKITHSLGEELLLNKV